MFPTHSLAQEKARLRRDMEAARSQFNEAQRARAALDLCESLCPFVLRRPGERVAVYLARPFELSLDPLIEALLESNVSLGAPRVDVAQSTMGFFALRALDAVGPGAWNVREPLSDEPFAPTLVLVPALALDPHGHRLGSGGGWYDRFLPPDCVAVGIGFDCQIVPHVPVEPHDRSMNHVWSDKRCFSC